MTFRQNSRHNCCCRHSYYENNVLRNEFQDNENYQNDNFYFTTNYPKFENDYTMNDCENTNYNGRNQKSCENDFDYGWDNNNFQNNYNNNSNCKDYDFDDRPKRCNNKKRKYCCINLFRNFRCW